MDTKEIKNCPYCGEEILAVAKKCRHCGEWLPEPSVPKQMIPCPICGEDVEEGTEVCPHCKEKIDTTLEPTICEPTQKPSAPTLPDISATNESTSSTSTAKASNSSNLFLWAGIAGFVVLVLIIILAKSSNNNNDNIASYQNESTQISTTSVTSGNTPVDQENIVDNTQETSTGGWQKDYVKDEFGNIDTSRPYIFQIWPGRRNDTFDCELGIRVTREFLQFSIFEEYAHPDLDGAVVTGQINGQKFQINYDEANNESIVIYNQEELNKVLSALNTDGTLMLSFRRTNSFGDPHDYLFTIYGSTNIVNAILQNL